MAFGAWSGERQTVADESVSTSPAGPPALDVPRQTTRRASAEAARIDELLTRMRQGDREAAAAFITRYGSRLRRRIRGKLGPAMRRLFDSQEILSTVSRRLDMYVRKGRMQAVHASQLWTLIFKMADNALIDKIRVFEHLQNIEGSDGTFARDVLSRLEQAEQESDSNGDGAEIEIEHAMSALSDRTDRTILWMWLMGHPHAKIAEELDMATTGVRKRWQLIKQKLRTRFEVGLDYRDTAH
jgi:DNA-directed RNA polymerase specialized sigma24 family protein